MGRALLFINLPCGQYRQYRQYGQRLFCVQMPFLGEVEIL